MAVEKALPREQPQESPETATTREILQVLVKAQKARRLYQAKNAIPDRLQKELYSKISAHLDEVRTFSLTIREFQILLGEDVVYESDDRNDSLAFLLFRDGIRRLTFETGLQEPELQTFLKCLNRVAVLSNEQDDLVTLFWDADFKSIKYYAIEELTDEPDGPRLQDQLASGSLGGREGAGAPPDAVSVKDVEQPVRHLPVEACRLREEEVEGLRAELAKEEEEPFGPAVVELAIELALLETSEEEIKALAEHLVSIVKRLLMDGDLDSVTQALEHLTGLTEMAMSNSEAVRHMCDRVVRFLSERKQLQQFLEQAESERSIKAPQMTAYFAFMGEAALPFLFDWMGRMGAAAHRRALSEAAIVNGEAALKELERRVAQSSKALDSTSLREFLFILSRFSEEQAVPLVERLLRSSDPLTRRETIQVLGRFKTERLDGLCLNLLSDEDNEVRRAALDTLVRRGRRELALPLLERALKDPAFDERSLSEKRRLCAAVAKIGGNEALGGFAEGLQSRENRWFAARKQREACEAIVHGIRMIGTAESRKLLKDMASRGNRHVRAACLKVLSERRT